MSMIEDPWAECTKKTEFVFADEPTDNDLVNEDEEPDTGLDLSVLSGSPNTVAAADESDDDDDE